MDNQISNWIIEFLLRQHVDDTILDRLLAILPLNDDDSRLKKALLLRRIETEVSKAEVSEKILEYLELIGELDYIEGKAASEAMRDAYCAVAVDCTVRFLGLRSDEKYLESLRRLWRGRVRKMEESENCGLVSDTLRSWRYDLEAARSDLEVRASILARNTRNEAVRAVKRYVKEFWEEMGPSVIEKSVEDVIEVGKDGDGVDERGEEERGGGGSDDVMVGCDEMDRSDRPSNENQQKQGGLPRRPHAGVSRGSSREALQGTRSKVRIINIEEVDIDTSTSKCDPIPTDEVDRIKADLLASFADLRAVVRDPLPEALKIAEAVVSDMSRERGLGGNKGAAMHEASTSIDKTEQTRLGANRLESVGGSDEHPEREDCRNEIDPSMTDLNPGSSSDPLEFSEELPSRPALSSPRRSKISPLKKYQMKKLTKRRPPKKWSVLEEDILRNGVEKFGRGAWKAIWDANRDIFKERTDVDLKDKWRNMTRFS